MNDIYKNVAENLREASRLLDSPYTILVNSHGLSREQLGNLVFNAAAIIDELRALKTKQATEISHACNSNCYFYDKSVFPFGACALHNTRPLCGDYKESFEPKIIRVSDGKGGFVDFLVQNERQLELLDELKLYKYMKEKESSEKKEDANA